MTAGRGRATPRRMRILVTGTTGNFGGAVASKLLARGDHVVVEAVRDPSRARGEASARRERVRFDLLDPSTHAPALAGVDAVVLVRPPAISNVKRDVAPFLRALAAARPRHVVFLSLQGVEDATFTPHHAIEAELRRLALPTTMLRPSFFMENLTGPHAREIRERDAIVVPAGSGATNFVAVDDIAEAAVVCLEAPEAHGGRAYDVTGDRAYTYDEVAAALSRELGRAVRYDRASIPRFVVHRVRAGDPVALALVMSALYTVARLGRAARASGDLRALGVEPTPLDRFVHDHRAAWLRA